MATTSLLLDALRIALAILLDTAALIIWDIGTRSPLRLVAEIRAGVRSKPTLLRGSVRFVLGAIAMLAAATVSAPVAVRAVDFTIVECWALVTALIIEQLVGPDLRARRR